MNPDYFIILGLILFFGLFLRLAVKTLTFLNEDDEEDKPLVKVGKE